MYTDFLKRNSHLMYASPLGQHDLRHAAQSLRVVQCVTKSRVLQTVPSDLLYRATAEHSTSAVGASAAQTGGHRALGAGDARCVGRAPRGDKGGGDGDAGRGVRAGEHHSAGELPQRQPRV